MYYIKAFLKGLTAFIVAAIMVSIPITGLVTPLLLTAETFLTCPLGLAMALNGVLIFTLTEDKQQNAVENNGQPQFFQHYADMPIVLDIIFQLLLNLFFIKLYPYVYNLLFENNLSAKDKLNCLLNLPALIVFATGLYFMPQLLAMNMAIHGLMQTLLWTSIATPAVFCTLLLLINSTLAVMSIQGLEKITDKVRGYNRPLEHARRRRHEFAALAKESGYPKCSKFIARLQLLLNTAPVEKVESLFQYEKEALEILKHRPQQQRRAQEAIVIEDARRLRYG